MSPKRKKQFRYCGGFHEECGQWLEALGEHYKGDVGLSPSA